MSASYTEKLVRTRLVSAAGRRAPGSITSGPPVSCTLSSAGRPLVSADSRSLPPCTNKQRAQAEHAGQPRPVWERRACCKAVDLQVLQLAYVYGAAQRQAGGQNGGCLRIRWHVHAEAAHVCCTLGQPWHEEPQRWHRGRALDEAIVQQLELTGQCTQAAVGRCCSGEPAVAGQESCSQRDLRLDAGKPVWLTTAAKTNRA